MAGHVPKKPEQSSELNENLNNRKWYHQITANYDSNAVNSKTMNLSACESATI